MNLRDKPQRGDQAKYHQTVEETDIIFCREDTKVSFVACLAEVFHLNQFTENIRRIHIEVLSSRLEPFECNYFQILLKFCRDVSPSLQLVVVNLVLIYQQHFSHSSGKESACNAGDSGSIPGLGRSPGEGNGNPLHILILGNTMDREPSGLQPIGSQESHTTQ